MFLKCAENVQYTYMEFPGNAWEMYLISHMSWSQENFQEISTNKNSWTFPELHHRTSGNVTFSLAAAARCIVTSLLFLFTVYFSWHKRGRHISACLFAQNNKADIKEPLHLTHVWSAHLLQRACMGYTYNILAISPLYIKNVHSCNRLHTYI